METIIKADKTLLDPVYEIVRASSDWMQEEYKFTHWNGWYTKPRIEDNFDHGEVYVLLHDDRPVGTYTVKKTTPSYYSEQDRAKFTDPEADAYYCYTLAVSPEFHGHGFAKKLLAHLEETAKENGIHYLRFDARAAYTQLIAFYQKMGFKIVGELDDEGDQYYLFEKIL